VDRSILGILSPVMLRDLHLSAEQYGAAIFVFSLCYMLANPIWGWSMDRFGLFIAIGSAVAVWSIASGAHALITGFLGLCVVRGLLGFGEGATFPAGLKTVTETLPAAGRSFGLGLAYSGGSLGALLTPIIVIPIAARWGWRSTFVMSAAVGFAWIGLWLAMRWSGVYRSASVERAEPGAASARGSRWNRALFGTAAVYGLGAAPLAFGLYAGPLYLTRVLHLPQASLGGLMWIPPAGWESGYLFWGAVADWRRKRAATGTVPSPLGIFLLFAVLTLALTAIPACAQLPHPVAITVFIFFLVMFCSGGYVVIALAYGATTQTAENTGFLGGFSISGWSLATGVLMWIVGRMFDRGLYSESFGMVGVLPWIGVGLWWLLIRGDSSGASERLTGPKVV